MKNNPAENLTPERIMQFAWGYAPTLLIATALQLRIFDLLENSPKTLDELARQATASKRGLVALLNALVGIRLLSKSGEHFCLTPESATFLVSTKPSFHGALFGHQVERIIPNWLRLTEVVRTGKPTEAANDKKESEEFFAGFVEALFPLSYHAARTLGEHLGIAKITKPISVLDLASGSGVWGIALAEQSPQVHVHAVDWPKVLEVTKRIASQHRVADRLTLISGDILKVDLGAGHTVATLGHILHSEGRERSQQLLGRTFAALAPGGTIAIAEFVPDDDRSGPPGPLIFSVNMLVNTEEGETFTFAEMSGWLREAGFTNPRKLDAGGVSPLILASKP